MIKVRQAAQSDMNFVYAAYLNSFDGLNPQARSMCFARPWEYYKFQSSALNEILSRKTARTLVATDVEDDDLLLGFLIYEPGVVHYAYTKASFRLAGVCNAMLKEAGLGKAITFTHWTPVVLELNGFKLTYDPRKVRWGVYFTQGESTNEAASG